MQNQIIIYTDGGCSGNPGPGGWGVVVLEGAQNAVPVRETRLSGGEAATTNNRMELTAAISALKFVQQNCSYRESAVTVFIDSQYVKNGITVWIKNWKLKGWKTADKKPVKNVDLWTELDGLAASFPALEWNWVKGHAGVKYNEVCDALCQSEIKKHL